MEHSPVSKSGMGALAYGIFSYGVFLGVFVYAVGFIGGFLTPTRLDGVPTRPFWEALAIDLGLLGLFAIQHSVMARPAFKRWWTKFVPEAVERSTYVLLSSLALVALFAWWQPIGGIVWETTGAARTAVTAAAILYAEPLQADPPPALRRLADDLLGGADDDGRAPRLRADDHRLHPHRHPARGA